MQLVLALARALTFFLAAVLALFAACFLTALLLRIVALVLVAASRGSAASLATLVLVVAARLAMSAAIVGRVLKMPDMLSELWMVPLKDLIMTGVWFASLLSNKVTWAGRQFKVIRGGVMREVKG